jgi:hypothetical protein
MEGIERSGSVKPEDFRLAGLLLDADWLAIGTTVIRRTGIVITRNGAGIEKTLKGI